jgi:ABC-type transporter Mla MlaB component
MVFRSIGLDCAGVRRLDLRTIDWIARLYLAAARAGVRLQLNNASQALLALIAFCGLSDVLGI